MRNPSRISWSFHQKCWLSHVYKNKVSNADTSDRSHGSQLLVSFWMIAKKKKTNNLKELCVLADPYFLKIQTRSLCYVWCSEHNITQHKYKGTTVPLIILLMSIWREVVNAKRILVQKTFCYVFYWLIERHFGYLCVCLYLFISKKESQVTPFTVIEISSYLNSLKTKNYLN